MPYEFPNNGQQPGIWSRAAGELETADQSVPDYTPRDSSKDNLARYRHAMDMGLDIEARPPLKKRKSNGGARYVRTHSAAAADVVHAPTHTGADPDALSMSDTDIQNCRSATVLAQPPLIIQDVFVEEGKLLFLLGSRVWLNYDQALRKGASKFLESRTLEDWSRVLRDKHPEQLKASPQGGIGMDGKIVDVELYDNELMFLFESDTIVADASALENLGVMTDAIQFCNKKTGWD